MELSKKNIISLFEEPKFKEINITNVVIFDNEVVIDIIINNPTLQARKKAESLINDAINSSFNDKLSLNPIIIYRSVSDLPNFVSGNISIVYQEKISVGTGLSNNDNISVFYL